MVVVELTVGLLAGGILLLLYLFYQFAYAPYRFLKNCGIKGPTPTAFFGNYRELIKANALDRDQELTKKYGPVVGFYIGKKPQIMISDLDILKEIMVKQFDNFSDHSPFPNFLSEEAASINLFTSRGEKWKKTRKTLSPSFSASKLKMFLGLVLAGATSPKLEAFILYSQIITTPANVRILLEVLDSGNYSTSQTLCRILASLYAVWNLDFFRTLLPNNCLKISTLQLLALDYIIAVYPIVLIVVTYIVVDLYDRELFPLVWLTNKFKHCAKVAGSTINLKSSILTAFSTFLILSYGKFLTVSFDLLDFTKVYTPDGKAIGNVLYYDASIEYFGKEHLPYGILAIAVTILFNILPLLFTLLHPLRCFKGHLGKWPALHICLDTFQGCYKDGTAGTRDCRFFSSLLFLIRIVLFVTYGFVKNTDFYRIASVLLLVLVLLISLFKPFKPQFATYNTVHVLMILNLAIWYILISSISLRTLESFSIVILYDVVCVTVAFIPLIYVTVLILKWFTSLTFFRRHCLKYFVCCHKRITGNSLSGTQDTYVDESFPHRLEHVSEEHPFRIAAINVPSYGSAEHRGDNTY